MQYLKGFRLHSIYIKTFIGLILFSLIPTLIAIAIIYNQSVEEVQAQTLISNSQMLEKTKKSVDLILRQLNSIIPQVANDEDVVQSVINPEYSNISRNSRTIGKLQNIAANNGFVHSIYVYSSIEDSVISSDGGVHRRLQFVDKRWKDSFDNLVLGTEEMATRIIEDSRGNEFHVITLIRNLPYGSWSKIGALVVNINQDQLFQAITGIDVENNGEYQVVNREGEIILHSDHDLLGSNVMNTAISDSALKNASGSYIKKDGEVPLLVSFTSSDYNDWKFIYTVPFTSIQDRSRGISVLILWIAIAYTIIGLILSYYISRYFYNPVKKLITDLVMVSDPTQDKEYEEDIQNEYDLIEYAYKKSIRKSETLESKVESFRPVMLERLFYGLITGHAHDRKEVEESLQALNSTFAMTDYVVFCTQIDSYPDYATTYNQSERNLHKLRIMRLAEQCTAEMGPCISMDLDKTIVATVLNLMLDNSISENYAMMDSAANALKEAIINEMPFTVTIGIGRICNSIMNLSDSLEEARKALEYKIYLGIDEVISINNIDDKPEELYYYSDKEKLLVNNLRIADSDAVMTLIGEIFKDIAENRNLSQKYIHQLFDRILNALIEVMIDLDLKVQDIFHSETKLYKVLEGIETIAEAEEWFKDVCSRIIVEVEVNQDSKGQKNIDIILDYINAHLSEDISLNDVADHVNLSPAYISKIFKESLNKNFVDYVNTGRVTKAKQLLEETRLTTKDIGFKVGYNSVQSFFRTFKKYEGITPGQYRDSRSERKEVL